jgi:energy-coupling factor transporter ATP-binding protein EcfA2
MSENKLNSKRDVLEFLWEWAEEKGIWAKLLLHEVLNTTEPLPDDKLKTIYRYFRKSIGLSEDIEVIEIQKPSVAFTGKSIKLKKLSKINGLNRLSPDSVIEFSPNLTVIYGENGTGKSGFSRILKDIGYSYEAETKLIPNIYSKDKLDISAEIEYTCDGVSKIFSWQPRKKQEELKNISVYNSSCVAISLSENRNLIVTPLGFSLFDRVSRELDALATLIANEKDSLTTSYDWFESFHEGTDYYNKIQNLQTLTHKDIEKMSEFTLEDEAQLSKLEKTLAGTSKELIEKEIKDLNTQHTELLEIKESIEKSKKIFGQAQWDEIIQIANKIKTLEEKGYGSLEELAKEKGIELYGKIEFENFIKAADAYIATLQNDNYPDSKEAKCIYCNQALSDNASLELIKKYRAILKDTTRQELEEQKKLFENLKKTFKTIVGNVQLHYPSYGQDENQKPIQPEFIKAYNAAVEKLTHSIDDNDFDSSKFSIDYDTVIKSLQEKIDEIKQLLETKNKTQNDIDSEKSRLTKEINTLKDKQLFTKKKEDILQLIDNYSVKKTLTQNEGAFNTASISTKTSKARKELIEQSFAETFTKELNNLRKSHINVELSFGTKKGGTNIRQCLQERYNLSDILSEGEQKAISLAEFFTELSIDGGNSTVVFDDPVNSLDHHIIDETAKRLIVFSKTRQTVIFTHSILLFNSLLYQSKLSYNKDIQKRFYNTKNQYELCGIITDADEEINSPKSYITKLNDLINNPPKSKPEAEVAAEGYGYLRSAIELTVEHEIFQGTVKRYQKNIALTNFSKISGAEIDKCKASLNDIFEKCCGYITGHSNPTEVVSTPDITQLKNDFEAYKKIREVFVK